MERTNLTPVQLQKLKIMQMQQQQRILSQTPRIQTQTPRPATDPSTIKLIQRQQMHQMMVQQQQILSSTPRMTPGSVQATPGMAMNRIPIRIPPKRPITINSTQSTTAMNTYAPRLKYGHTSLVTPMSPKEKSRKRSRFVEDRSESESDQSFDDSEESGRVMRSTRASTREEEIVPEIVEEKEIPKFELKKMKLNTTKHDYEKINLYRLDALASVQEVLVPIHLDFDIDGFKIQDQFTWNLNESMISVEKFAEYLCNDLDINPSQYVPMIARNIKAQLEDFKRFYQIGDVPVVEDTRIVVNLDISLGKVHLRDRFEWDIASQVSPESFARSLVKDLALGGEFVSLVAHSIREQIYRVRQSGEIEPTFPIEKPLRSEEEAKGWAPFVDTGDRSEAEDDVNLEEDRKQRFLSLIRLLRRQQRLNQSQRKRGGSFVTESYYQPPVAVSMQQPHIQSLPEEIRTKWKCSHCLCHVSKTTGISDGPAGPQTLCYVCGIMY